MRVESQAALRDSEHESLGESVAPANPTGLKELTILFFLTAFTILVHGYHPFVEDAEIYVPGIKKLLNPALYPYNDVFFASHARMTLFPNLIAWSVRITHLPLEWVLMAWYFVCVFSLLLACWKLGRICFRSSRAALASAVLVASVLTIPVAGTALYIVDQYLNTRSFSTASVLWIIIAAVQRQYARTAAWFVLSALIHPLMAAFGLVYAVLLLWRRWVRPPLRKQYAFALMLSPVALFPEVTGAYKRALDSHPYFFLLRWEWYEWVGILAPLLILWGIGRIARRKNLATLELLCSTSIIFGAFFFVAGLVITIPRQFARFVELQPMRSLHLIYILFFVILGGMLAEHVLRARIWRWLALFCPLCLGMFYAQRRLFPVTPHLEWPGRKMDNEWVQGFAWIRDNTPANAYFVLNPNHMRLPGEDQHGFRAIAERSMLADQVKDSGAVTMFPALAQTWLEQVSSEDGWANFTAADFERLHRRFGVDWVVLERAGVADLECPYRNSTLLVCQIGLEPQRPKAQ